MAITESLPVGKDVAVTAGAGRTATVDATAFAVSLAAAGKASGGLFGGKEGALAGGPDVPVKGQKDLAGWGTGQGTADGDELQEAHGDGAVSSSIGKQVVVEAAAAGKDLQQATVGAGMQQAVWTASGAADTTVRTPVKSGASEGLAAEPRAAGTGPLSGKSAFEPSKEIRLPVVPAAAPTTSTVAASPLPAEASVSVPDAPQGTAATGHVAPQQVQAPAAAGTLVRPSSAMPLSAEPGGALTGTAKGVAAEKVVNVGQTRAGDRTGRQGDKALVAGRPIPKAPVTAETTPKVSAGAPAIAPAMPSEAKPSVDESAVKTSAAEAAAVAVAPVPVTDAGSKGVRRADLPLTELTTPGKTVTAIAAPRAARRGPQTVAKIEAAPEKATATGDGTSVLPLVTGVAVAVPQGIAPVQEKAAAPKVGAAGSKGGGKVEAGKDQDGKRVTESAARNTEERSGDHVAAAELSVPVSATGGPESLGAGKNSPAHEGAASGSTVAAMEHLPVVASNAHAVAPMGTVVPPAAVPVRAEAVAVATAAPTSRADDTGLGFGAGMSSGLVSSGQGHTTLQATPTVLEVGVPGGTHGWLKIRAELGEGGAVQASVSSATEAGQETLRKELPAMSAYLQSEHVPVSLQMAHGVAGAAAGDGLAAGLGFGGGNGSHAGTNPEQSRNEAAGFAGVSTGSGEGAEPGSGRRQGSDGGPGNGLTDGVSSAVTAADADWTSPLGYGGVSLTTGGSWVNVIA